MSSRVKSHERLDLDFHTNEKVPSYVEWKAETIYVVDKQNINVKHTPENKSFSQLYLLSW